MALPADVNYSDKNVRVFTRGLKTTVKALEAAGVDAQDMRAVFRKAGEIVKRKVHVDVRTGHLAGSVRLGVYKNKATVKMGRASVPYAARYEYGAKLHLKNGQVHKIEGHLALREAVRQGRNEALRTIVTGIDQLCKKHGIPSEVKVTGYIVKRIGKFGVNRSYSTDSQYLS